MQGLLIIKILILVSWRWIAVFVNALDNPTVQGNGLCIWQREIDWSWYKLQTTELTKWYLDS